MQCMIIDAGSAGEDGMPMYIFMYAMYDNRRSVWYIPVCINLSYVCIERESVCVCVFLYTSLCKQCMIICRRWICWRRCAVGVAISV